MDYLRVYDMLKKHGAYTEPDEEIVVNAFEDEAEAAAEEYDGAAETDYFDSILESFSKHVAVDDNGDFSEKEDTVDSEQPKQETNDYDMVGADDPIDEEFGDGTKPNTVETVGEGESDNETVVTVNNDVVGDLSSDENDDDLTTRIKQALERSEMDSIDDSMEEIEGAGKKSPTKKKKKPAAKKPATKKTPAKKPASKPKEAPPTPAAAPAPAIAPTPAPAPALAPIIPLNTAPVATPAPLEVPPAQEETPPTSDVEQEEKQEENEQSEGDDVEEEEETDDNDDNDDVENGDNMDTEGGFDEINAIVSKFKKISV